MGGSRSKRLSAAGLRVEMLEAVASLLAQAKSALFITGPFLSADSGLHHYRGIPGLHKKKPEDARLFEASLALDTFRRKPITTWSLLVQMEEQVRLAQPNRGHEVIAQLERRLARVVVMTTNVDRLHQRAGSKSVIEMHGALHDLLCSRCEMSVRCDSFARLPLPPACSACTTILKPDMPLFGEMLPADPFTRLQLELDEGFDIVIAVGIGTMFPYLARPLLVAKADGIPTVEIGSTPTDVSEIVDFRFRGTPMRVLDLLLDLQSKSRHA